MGVVGCENNSNYSVDPIQVNKICYGVSPTDGERPTAYAVETGTRDLERVFLSAEAEGVNGK